MAEVEAACRRVVVAFSHHIDHREFERVAELFAPDGVWDRHGERLTGPGEILRLLRLRPDTRLERHVLTTILVTALSPVECSVVSYALIFRADTAAVPATVPAPAAVGEFHDRLRRTDAVWRLTHRSSTPIFVIDPR